MLGAGRIMLLIYSRLTKITCRVFLRLGTIGDTTGTAVGTQCKGLWCHSSPPPLQFRGRLKLGYASTGEDIPFWGLPPESVGEQRVRVVSAVTLY